MKIRKIVYWLTSACLTFGLCACNERENGNEDDTSTILDDKETTTQISTTTTDLTTEKPTPSASETETTTNQEDESTTIPKTYDVYVNDIGFDIGSIIDVKVNLKAPDKEFRRCCPSFNVFLEGETNPEKIENSLEMDFGIDYINPLLINNVGSPEYDKSYYSYWGYYDLLALWNSPDASPLDITEGIHVFSARITLKEAGKYTITATSGNGAEGMEEEFAKYDNCFSVEISLVS